MIVASLVAGAAIQFILSDDATGWGTDFGDYLMGKIELNVYDRTIFCANLGLLVFNAHDFCGGASNAPIARKDLLILHRCVELSDEAWGVDLRSLHRTPWPRVTAPDLHSALSESQILRRELLRKAGVPASRVKGLKKQAKKFDRSLSGCAGE
ncbi:hypothetical protein [Pseudomonas sp. 10-1B]|uniref:hypothetical protein n=1 Tax=Pseudomonas sp. 10-1B TaxID=1546029 RepID=UPI001364DB05|nr:hypothetical protein [Pseudomonas sp. 10-1B]